jgi:hypothetical protein
MTLNFFSCLLHGKGALDTQKYCVENANAEACAITEYFMDIRVTEEAVGDGAT